MEIVVRGECSDADLARIRRLTQAPDARRTRVRRAVMTLAELRRCLRAGRTLAVVVAQLDTAHVRAVPPLTVVSENGGPGRA